MQETLIIGACGFICMALEPISASALERFGYCPLSWWLALGSEVTSKGLEEGEVRRNHILRNALIDTNTMIAVTFGFLLSGTIVIEEIFAWPGVGYFTYQAIVSANYPVLIPCVLIFTLGVIAANFVADVFYSLLDPRIALGEGGVT